MSEFRNGDHVTVKGYGNWDGQAGVVIGFDPPYFKVCPLKPYHPNLADYDNKRGGGFKASDLKRRKRRADTNDMDNFDRLLERLDASPELRSIDVTDQMGRRRAVVVKPAAFDELMRQAPKSIAAMDDTLRSAYRSEKYRSEKIQRDLHETGAAFLSNLSDHSAKQAPPPNNSGLPDWLTISGG